jgi:hypothetical protein
MRYTKSEAHEPVQCTVADADFGTSVCAGKIRNDSKKSELSKHPTMRERSGAR